MPNSLIGKVALITGASSGIGAATAVKFVAEGASVALTGRNKDNLQATVDKCKALLTGDQQVFSVIGDVCKEEDVQRILDESIKKFNKLDILVNNAGLVRRGGIEDTSLEQYDLVMNTNMRSVYHLTMLAVPHLIKTKGNIVNVSSTAGIRSYPSILAYCMSKSALDQFTKCIALELASKQVRVNSMNPAHIKTNILTTIGVSEEALPKFYENVGTDYPMGRVGEVEEAADAILYLASAQSSFVTGVQLLVDGGRTLQCPI